MMKNVIDNKMVKKHIFYIIVLSLFILCFSCRTQYSYLVPNDSYILNSPKGKKSLSFVYEKYRFTMLIAYKLNNSNHTNIYPAPYKILARKNHRWYKLDLYVHGSYSGKRDSLVVRSPQNIKYLLDNFHSNHLFDINQNDLNIDSCAEIKDEIINGKQSVLVNSLSNTMDAATITFTIMEGNQERIFSCFNPWGAVKICPKMTAYQDVLNMYNAIKEYW